MNALWHDLRGVWRGIRRAPALPAFVVVMLALSIGSVSSLFSMVRGLILRPLPYPAAERLVIVWNNNTRAGVPNDGSSLLNLGDYRTRSTSLQGLAAFFTQGSSYEAEEGAVIVPAAYVSSHFFPVMGHQAAVGRVFAREDDILGSAHIAVLSHRFWKRHLGSNPDVVGRTIVLNHRPVRVVGVMPPALGFPRDTDIWLNLPMGFRNPEPYERREYTMFFAIARLRAGTSAPTAERELNTVAAALEREYPAFNTGYRVGVVPLRVHLLGESRAMVLLSFGTAALVLLIACANIASLLVARAASRQRDVAIRLALGAERWHLVRQLLVESVVLSLAGGVAGLALARAAMRAFVAANPFHIEGLDTIRIDSSVMAITIAVAGATGILFGLLPAWQATRPVLTQALKDSSQATTGSRQAYRTREVLLVIQVALAMVLLAGAGLTVQSFRHLQQASPGFRTQRMLTFKVSLHTATYTNTERAVAFHRQLLAGLAALPGVTHVGSSDPFFADFVPTAVLEVEGRVASANEGPQEVGMNIVSPDFFRTLEISLQSGRSFDDRDNLQAPRVIMVNDAMAKRFWPGGSAVGKRVRSPDLTPDWMTVVGVVSDYHHLGVDKAIGPEMYVPLTQTYAKDVQIFVATSIEPGSLAGPVQRTMRDLDKSIPIQELRPLDELMAARLAARYYASLLLGIFGVVALTLALSGIYGTWSHQVARRAKEIAVRLALGAQASAVRRMIVRRGVVLVLIGLGVGWAAALALARVLSASLPGVSGRDLPTLAAVSVLLLVTTVLACYVPARRATRTRLTETLRSE